MFGSHLSIAGGLHHALLEAERLDMETVQVFTANPRTFGMATKAPTKRIHKLSVQNLTKNQQQWKCRPLDAETCGCWAKERDRLKFRRTVSHASYLINLASPDEVLWEKSIALFVEELSRCATLGIPYLVMHPGAHMGAGEEAGVKRIAAAIDRAHQAVGVAASADGVTLCLEATAGQGSSLGCKLEHLAEIIALVDEPKRMGVCLDTAHLFAAGYDFRGKKYAAFRKHLARTVGLKRVKVLHLNDSKKELGSRVDRHEHIGLGMIGVTGFAPFVQEEAFAKVPKILETPKGKRADGREWDVVNIEVLRGMMD
jgi:deoxyribonuclease-4